VVKLNKNREVQLAVIKKEHLKDYLFKTPLERMEEKVGPLPEEIKGRIKILEKEAKKELRRKRCSRCKNSDACVLYREIKSTIIKYGCILKNKTIIEEIENILASACTWYREV